MKRLEKTIDFVIRFRLIIVVVLLFLTAAAGFKTLKNLSVDNSLSIWFLEDNPNYKAYIDYQEEFGSDEIFVGMLPVENALSESHIIKLKEFHKALDSLWFVNASYSLATAKYPIYANNKIVFDDLYNANRSEKGMRSLLSKIPNISYQLVSEDFKNLFFYIQLKPTPNIETDRVKITSKVKELVEVSFEDHYLTGAPILNEAYSGGIYKESLLFGALTLLVITVLLLFLLPSKRYLPLALFAVVIPLTLLFGLITSMGFALNMISMLIPTILMVYSVSDVVHIINIYNKEGLERSDMSRPKLIALSVYKSFTPCFYTTLTTLVGYFALYLSPLPAFKNMGIFTCIGLLLAFVLVYLITIIGFSYLSLNFQKDRPVLHLKFYSHDRVVLWLNRVTSTYKNSIITVFTVLLIFGLYSIFNIKVDTNSLDLLAQDKPKEELLLVEDVLKSSSRLQINISAKNGSMITSEAMNQLEDFQKKLEANPLVAYPVSVISIKNFLEKRSPVLFQSNISEEKISEIISASIKSKNQFFTLFSDDYSSAGITLGIKEIKTSELELLLEQIKNDFISSFNTAQYDLKVNGFSVVFAQLNKFILETQFKSFFSAFFVAFLCLWFFIKSFKTTVLVLIPNVLPLAILAIFMSLLNIPLDITTAMITPIMLGIAMDDTIHLVYKYRKSDTITGSAEKRINNALAYTGGALFSSTIALVGGFLIISSSAVPSVSDFGLLCAITVAIALITDVFYLPALLKKFDK